MHVDGFVRGKGKFIRTEYVATDEKTGPRFPLLLTTGRILSQYNVGAQTRRTDNVVWHDEDVLEIHPHDAEQRGINDGDWVRLASRSGETSLRAQITDRVAPGVVYTTFHHPGTQANVITTDYSDWATNCPEYKVTAVQVSPSNGPTEWQERYEARREQARRILRGTGRVGRCRRIAAALRDDGSGARDVPEPARACSPRRRRWRSATTAATHAVMMATPADLEDFALGFSLNEGIVTSPDEIERIDAVEVDDGIDLQIRVPEGVAERLSKRRRAMAGPVGCGLCGIESIEEAMRSRRAGDQRLRHQGRRHRRGDRAR